MPENSIHFLRTELLGLIENFQNRDFITEDAMKRLIDLSCENIIEHFRKDD